MLITTAVTKKKVIAAFTEKRKDINLNFLCENL